MFFFSIPVNADNSTTIEWYPPSPIAEYDDLLTATINGTEVEFEKQRTYHPSKPHFMLSSRVWFAADGPVEVELNIDYPITEAFLRTIGVDLEYELDGSTLLFELPGPGMYYLQLPELNENVGTENFGTYTVLFWIDDLDHYLSNRVYPGDDNVIDITTQDVVSDHDLDQTSLIQDLISSSGIDGIVYFPAGIYRTGRLAIPSNTTIYMAPGSHLKGLDDYHLTSPVDRGAYIAIGVASNIKIFGPGTIDANGMIAYRSTDGDATKTRSINLEYTDNVIIEDVLIKDSNSWGVHIYRSTNFTARNVKLFSGKDGFDPDASRDVLLEDILVQSYDDAVAVKARSTKAGETTERITVRRAIVSSVKSSLKIGTETRLLMQDILFEDCDVFDGERGIVLYARDGGPIDNIVWRNIRLHMRDWPDESNSGSVFHILIEDRTGETPVTNALIENIKANFIWLSEFRGLPDAPLDDLTMRNLEIFVDPPKDGKPPLFLSTGNVDIRIDDLAIHWQGNEEKWGGVTAGEGITTSVYRNKYNGIPNNFKLHQNYPNPFNPNTIITIDVPMQEFVDLSIYDIVGKKVVTLIHETMQPGRYSMEFNGNNISSGIYFYRLKSQSVIVQRRMVFSK